MNQSETPSTFELPEASRTVPQGGLGGLFLSVALGVLGVAMGGIALFLVLNSSSRSEGLEAALERSADDQTQLVSRITQLENQLAKLASEAEAQDRQIRNLASQSQTALNQLGQEISSTRRDTVNTADKVRVLTERLGELSAPPAVPSSAQPTTSTPAATSEPPAGPEGHREHIIASGDTFSRLAARYNVTIDQILAANPDADPRRLQVGQRIRIPHGPHARE